jgi:hypothetical protein
LYSLAKLMFVVKGSTYFLLLNKRYILWVWRSFYFLLFFFWQFPFIPIVAIGLKSILVTLAYTYINYKFVISIEINEVIDTVFKNWILSYRVKAINRAPIQIRVFIWNYCVKSFFKTIYNQFFYYGYSRVSCVILSFYNSFNLLFLAWSSFLNYFIWYYLFLIVLQMYEFYKLN